MLRTSKHSSRSLLSTHCSPLTAHLTGTEKVYAADLQAQQPLTAQHSLLSTHCHHSLSSLTPHHSLLTTHCSPDSNRETKCCGPPSTAGAHLTLTEKLNAADIQALNAADLQAQQPLTAHRSLLTAHRSPDSNRKTKCCGHPSTAATHCSPLTTHLTVTEKLNAADLQAQQPLTAHCSPLTTHLTVTEKLNAADRRPTSSTAKPPVLQAEAGLGLTA